MINPIIEPYFKAWINKEHPYMKAETHAQKMAINRMRVAFYVGWYTAKKKAKDRLFSMGK